VFCWLGKCVGDDRVIEVLLERLDGGLVEFVGVNVFGVERRQQGDCLVAHCLLYELRLAISARPRGDTKVRNTPSWQFSIRPAVPEYWRWTPAEQVPYGESAIMPQRA
jgi:hypothetical protein